MKTQITNNVFWVGKVDWELRKFHGEEYTTRKGSSYNSYLIRDQKIALIDTVWKPFAKEFVENLEKEVGLKNIDFIIANHAEIDHSGALPELIHEIPDKPIYCTANGIKSLKGHFHEDWNFHPVKTGDRLSLGKSELIFIEAPMLHWPDSMMEYLTVDGILFSNDAFGQHLATEHLFNDLVNESELYEEAIKYYANILSPFSPLVVRKIEELLSLNLPVNIICPSHGVIWRKEPLQIVNKYLEWAKDYRENQVTIVYDTMWNGTRRLAEAIAKGIKENHKDVNVKLYNIARSDMTEVIAQVFVAKAILLGSPTINRGVLSAMSAFLDVLRGLKLKGKKAASFGCYGWSGESVKILNEGLKDAGFELLNDGFKIMWEPSEKDVMEAFQFGRDIGLQIRI